MTKEFRNSNFARRPNEQYFTQPKFTKLILPYIPERVRSGIVWEPAAGRGDITRVLIEAGYEVASSDIDTSQFDGELGSIRQTDFLAEPVDLDWAFDVSAVITNPPYGHGADGEYRAESFVRKSLDYGIDFIAMFLPGEFNTPQGRVDLFTEAPFAFEIVCLERPRWDWWPGAVPEPDPDDEFAHLEKKKKKSPIHNYSWFVWDRQWQKPCTTFWASTKGVVK